MVSRACFTFVVLALLASAVVRGEEYVGTGATVGMSRNLRSVAMGGVSVGLPPPRRGAPSNAAALAFCEGRSIYSSAYTRFGAYNAGQIAVTLPHVAAWLDYVQVGDVPITDEFGNISGQFAYRSCALSSAAGMRWSELPVLADAEGLRALSTSLRFTMLRDAFGDFGSGFGARLDLEMLIWARELPRALAFPEDLAVGLCIKNLLSHPMSFDSGHSEDWTSTAEFGISARLPFDLLIASDFSSDGTWRLGVEWSTTPSLEVRAGACGGASPALSMGVGLALGQSVVDAALTWQRHLPSELRVGFTYTW